jgi:hypothetical protein
MVTIRRNSLACQDQPGCLLFSINVRSTYLPHLFQKNWNADKIAELASKAFRPVSESPMVS